MFSSSASPFDADGKYNKFSAYALLNHGGDYSAAARELANQGYGAPRRTQPQQQDAGPDGQTIPKRERITFGRMTSAELFGQDFTVKYLIEGVLAEQQHGVISGRFKSQKSHIAVAAAISIATGCKFLNRFEVTEQRRVGVFCGEGGPAPLQRMAMAICAFQDVRVSQLDRLFWYTRVPHVNDLAHRVALLDTIAADKLEVLFLDPTYLLLSGVSEKASNYLVMAETLSLLTDIGQQRGPPASSCTTTRRPTT